MPIVSSLTIWAANRPGALARVAETLAKNRINIAGIDFSGPPVHGHLPVNNPEKAGKVLKQACLGVRFAHVIVVTLGHRLGTLARVARNSARPSINYAYGTVACGGKREAIVIGVAKPKVAAGAV